MGWEVSYEIEVLMGKSWETHGKIMGKSRENHGKIMGTYRKRWDIHCKWRFRTEKIICSGCSNRPCLMTPEGIHRIYPSMHQISLLHTAYCHSKFQIIDLSQHPHNIMIIIFPVLLLLTSGFVVEIFGLIQAVSSVCFPTFLHFAYVISQYRFK